MKQKTKELIEEIVGAVCIAVVFSAIMILFMEVHLIKKDFAELVELLK